MDDGINKVCVIVGAGEGIGLAVARRFGVEGYAIGLIARRADKLAAMARELQEAGVEALGFPADVADVAAIKNALSHVEEQFGTVSVLVYNVARVEIGWPSELDSAALLDDMRLNVVGMLTCAQVVVPVMRECGGGTILVTGGGLALRPMAEYASLSAGKAALRSLTFSLAQELTEDNIHVATVTVAGFVKVGTFFDPNRIAEVYWQLHGQNREAWETEIVYREG